MVRYLPSNVQTLGKYQLLKKLATGGMAEVFLARADGPMGFAKKCVVKRILPHFNDDPRFVEMFLGEARLAAEMNHPNLVQIFDFGEAGGQYYLAMEFIDGPNLRTLNQLARAGGGALDFAVAARLIALAADGLHYAHELKDEHGQPLNLVHRDISPDNLLVSRAGSVKVVDFGIAKASNQPHLTKSGMIKGKLAYMPPEQLAREPLDRRADVFALGIVLYELITGGMPFDATSEVSIIQALMSQTPLERPTVFRPDCPPALEDIVLTCLSKDRTKRFATCHELQSALEAFITSTGRSVGTRDISQLVEQTIAQEEIATVAEGRPLPDPMLEETSISGVSRDPRRTDSGLSSTALRPVPAEPPPTPRTNRGLLMGVGIGLVVLVGAAIAFALTRPAQAVPEVPKPPVVVADAGAPPEPEPVDAGVAVAPPLEEEDAGVPEAVDAGQPEVKPAPVRMGRLELRIRPYATVFLDDKLLGDTPLAPVNVPVGNHKLVLVNQKLGKNVTLDVHIKPGDNVVKHNLKE